jgi:hypothetical protein
MRKAILLTVLVAAALCAFAVTQFATAAASEEFQATVGDTVLVDEAPVGCRVTRLARYGNRVFLDCRRGGRLAGSLGAYFGEKDVLVVRFVGPRKAKTVLHARHEGGVAKCS